MFPGVFSYADFLSVDYAELECWEREAARRLVLRKIEAIRMSRMAWAGVDDVRKEVLALQAELGRLDGEDRARQDRAWGRLRQMGRM